MKALRAALLALLMAVGLLSVASPAQAATELVVNDGPYAVFLVGTDGSRKTLVSGATSRYVMSQIARVEHQTAICGKKSVNYGPWVLSGQRFGIADGTIVHVKSFRC